MDEPEQEKPQYDQAELQRFLEAGFRSSLKKALNDVEPVLEATLNQVGNVLDDRIKKVQTQLKVCCIKPSLTLVFRLARVFQ